MSRTLSRTLQNDFAIPKLPDAPMNPDQFFKFCEKHRKVHFERTANGEIIVMPPAGGECSAQHASALAQLFFWAQTDGTGKIFESSIGYDLPNGAMRSPDASWVSNKQLASISREQLKKFLPVCPELFVEIMSPSDSLRQTKEKMEEFIANGAKLGWLIDSKKRQVHVYRPNKPVEILDDPATLSGEPEFPGLVLDLASVWNP